MPLVLERFIPTGLNGPLIDFGCGTGRAMLKLAEHGVHAIGVDFAENCRDEEALGLPFVKADLTRPIPVRGAVGMCTDVMEHIWPAQVDEVIKNIMSSVPRCLFQISTVPDACGALIGAELHHTVWPESKWRRRFEALGYEIEAYYTTPSTVVLIVRNPKEHTA